MRVLIIILSIMCLFCSSIYAAIGDIMTSFAVPDGMGLGSRGLAWDGQNLWNSNMATDMIYKINPTTGNIISSLSSPNINSGDLTFVGNDLWNVDIFSRTFYSIDPAVGPPWATEFVKPGNDYMGLTYDGTYIWSADFNSDTIDKLDINGNIISSFSSPGIGSQGLAWDGQYLWNTDANTDMIYKIDPATGNVVLSFPTPGPDPTGLAFDGQYLWVTDLGTDQIYKLDLGYTPAPPGVITLISMLGGLGGWAGIGRLRRRKKK